MNDFAERSARFELRQKEAFNTNRKNLMQLLQKHAITSILIEFNGSDDEGGIQAVTISKDGATIDMPDERTVYVMAQWAEMESRETSLLELAESVAMDAITLCHSGWENNEGAFGNIVIDPAEDMIAIEHNNRLLSYETFNHSL